MRLGALLSTSRFDDTSAISDRAAMLEGEGYTSLWALHATGRGFMMVDPLMALAAAATVTREVELGTAILQLPLYHPTDIALKALSLHALSNGRFLLGVGAGSTESDYQAHERPFASRFEDFDRVLSQLRAILEHGESGGVDLSAWPATQPGPRIIFGTWGKNVERAASEFDGWMASAMHRSVEECTSALARYRHAGGTRAIVTTIIVRPGMDPGELKDTLARYDAAGFDDAVLFFMPGGPSPREVRNLLR